MLVTVVTQAALAAKQATAAIPIVMVGVSEPVGVGLVASLARPGGNVTGTSALAANVVGKQLESLREMLPKVSGWPPSGTPRILCSRSFSWGKSTRPPRSCG